MQQELADRCGLLVKHLVDEVVQHQAVTAGELANEPGDVSAASQRQGDQLQPRDPSFGAGLECVHVERGEPETHHLVEEARCLARGEP